MAGEANLNWSATISLTRWQGIVVGGDPRRVVALDLPDRGLTGVIPPEIGMLTGLEFIDLCHNSLAGAIPPELGNLTKLQFVNLSVNGLSGGIPANFGRLANLEWLDLSKNQLTGEVPVELTQLSNLERFSIRDTSLSGCVPDALIGIASIGTLSFCGDSITIWSHRPTFEGGVDLGVTYIERLPRFQRYKIAYFGHGDCPYPFDEFMGAVVCPDQSGIKRWPDPGESVELIAHVWNFGDAASGPFEYEWERDDRSLMTGLHDGLEPGEHTEFVLTLEWPDDAANPAVTFAVDPHDRIDEIIENNNAVVDWIKGYTLGVFFSPEAYESLRLPNQPGVGMQSPEQWVQQNIFYVNDLLSRAGLEDRMRAELLSITDEEGLRYRHVLQWYMDGWWGIWHHKNSHYTLKNYTERPNVDWALLHELMHQLGVIDIYRMHLKTNQVMLPDANRAGKKAGCGTVYWGDEEVCFRFPEEIDDLMASWWRTYVGPHTAGGLRSNTGYRRGFYGEYLYDTPEETVLRVVDQHGAPVPDVTLSFYQTEPVRGRPVVDATPEFEVTSDESGLATLPNRGETGIVTATGHQLRPNPFGHIDVVGRNGLFIIEMEGPCTNYDWLTIVELNLSYWDGQTDKAVFTKVLHCPPKQVLIGL